MCVCRSIAAVSLGLSLLTTGAFGQSGQQIAQLRRADTDGDGRVSWQEVQQARPQLPKEAFDRLDTNDDGFLDDSDRRAGNPERSATPLMRRADTDRDGVLSREEARAAFPRMNDQRFAQLDGNSDGELSQDELARLQRAAGRADRKDNRASNRSDEEASGALAYVIEKSDEDGDGRVSYEELVAAKPGFPESTFKRLDRNKDGVLSQGD